MRFFYFLLLFSLAYAVPAELEVLKQTQVGVEINRTYTISIENGIPGLTALAGKTYTTNVVEKTTGLFLNNDGDIMAPSLTDERYEKKALSQVSEEIMQDVAKVEHIKKFGREPDNQEIIDYINYFKKEYGDIASMYGKFKIKKDYETFTVLYQLDRIPAQFISDENGVMLLEIPAGNYPAISLVNKSIANGSKLYAIDQNESKTIVVEDSNLSEISVDKKVNDGSIVLDENYDVVGYGIGSKIKASSSILEQLEAQKILNNETSLTQNYLKAIKSYENGDYETAKKELEGILRLNPEDSFAKSELAKISGRLDFGLIALVGILLLAILVIMKLTEKKRGYGRR